MSSTTTESQQQDIRRVCILGAGPSGLAAAKGDLLDLQFKNGRFSRCWPSSADLFPLPHHVLIGVSPPPPGFDVFEQRSTVGGVWNINSKNARQTPIPSTDPFGWKVEKPPSAVSLSTVITTTLSKEGQGFDSALYPTLETNIPRSVMAYSSLPFNEETTSGGGDGRAESITQSNGISSGAVDGLADQTHSSSSSLSGASSTSTLSRRGENDDGDEKYYTKSMHEDSRGLPLFPHHTSVMSYIKSYAEPVLPHIHFSTQVTSMSPIPMDSRDKSSSPDFCRWSVTTLDLQTDQSQTTIYDAVVIANGHYTVPYVPPFPGVEEWRKSYPSAILHSRDFRSSEDFRDKKVVVVGAGFSALDLIQQIGQVCQKPLIRVTRATGTVVGEGQVGYNGIEDFIVPESNAHEKGSIRFVRRDEEHDDDAKDGHETSHFVTETDIDKVVFATGYLYTFPFFPDSLQDSLLSPTGSEIGPGQRIHGLYKQLFLRRYPSCVFLTMPLKVVPFPLAEAQADVAARVWSSRLSLPSSEEMEKEESETVARKGEGKKYHTMEWPQDVDYYNGLLEWVASAEEEGSSVEQRIRRRMWGDEMRWLRKRNAETRRKYIERGTGRKHVKSLKELGIDYQNATDETG